MKNMTFIPAKPQKGNTAAKEEVKKLRVAAYCRVSTDNDEQASSYEAQIQHYEEFIKTNPEWDFVGVYADEGISATNTKKREQFNAMIEDCKAGKIDMIFTKSISRFARNTLDCLQYIRLLREMNSTNPTSPVSRKNPVSRTRPTSLTSPKNPRWR
ncbi:MAG: recombinase family protein [Bacteroidales bacterium]|nr:recombinase family protein [Bacteroidales bacterium]